MLESTILSEFARALLEVMARQVRFLPGFAVILLRFPLSAASLVPVPGGPFPVAISTASIPGLVVAALVPLVVAAPGLVVAATALLGPFRPQLPKGLFFFF